MADTFQDTFVGTLGTDLAAHTPDIGSGYTASTEAPGPILLDGAGSIYSALGGIYFNPTVPGTNPGDYPITFDAYLENSAASSISLWLARVEESALTDFNYAGVTSDVSNNVSFNLVKQIASVQTNIGTFALAPPSYPCTYHCSIAVSGTNVVATISGGEIVGTHTISVPGGAATNANTAHGPYVSGGYAIRNVAMPNNTTVIPVSSGNLANLGLSHEMFDTSAIGSGFIDSLLPGACVDTNWTLPAGGGAVTMNCDTSMTGQVQILTIVDGVYSSWTRTYVGVDAPSGNASVTVSGLSAGNHRIQFYNAGDIGGGTGFPYDRWVRGAGSACWRFTGFTVPIGTTLNATSRPANYIMYEIDSIGEGTFTDPSLSAGSNNWLSWTNLTARALGVVNNGTQIRGIALDADGFGYTNGIINPAGSGPDGWDHVHSTLARTFAQAPVAIFLCIGTNEWYGDELTAGTYNPGGGATTGEDIPLAANIVTWIGRVRAKSTLGTVPIYISVAFGGYKRGAVIAAVATYKAAHPSEPNLYVFDMGHGSVNLTTNGPGSIDEVALMGGLTLPPNGTTVIPSSQSDGRVHPNGPTDIQIATVFAALFGGGFTDVAPATAALTAGHVSLLGLSGTVDASATRNIGGSALLTSQFQKSTDGGTTWSSLGSAIDNQSATISPFIAASASGIANGTLIRLRVSDGADTTPVVAYSAPQTYNGTALYDWYVVPPSDGTIAANGPSTAEFTAGSGAATCNVIAVKISDQTKVGAAEVVIT